MNLIDFLKNSDQIKNAIPIPWNDSIFSQRSLQLHLDQKNDVNSRRKFIINKHTNWLHSSILQSKKSKILDLACGPGLYTSKLSQLGHICKGVDISPFVIKYAQEQNHDNCQYVCHDILNFITDEQFDLVLLNFGWFHNFTKEKTKILLQNISQMLKPEGQLILELLNFDSIRNYGLSSPEWHTAKSGIFSDKPYLFLQENIWDETNKLASLFYHIIVSEEEIKTYIQTYQGYNDNELLELLKNYYFRDFNFYNNLCEEDDFDEELYFLSMKKIT